MKRPRSQPRPAPSGKFLQELRSLGYERIVGVDEVGRGALAGPICVAAVEISREIAGIDDSKKITANQRERICEIIRQQAVQISYGWASNAEIDQLGLAPALNIAYERALRPVDIDLLLTDNYTPSYVLKHIRAVRGDQLFYPVAAASIVAKVCRDQLMRVYAEQFPNYLWQFNAGYGTPAHKKVLDALGPCPLHRRSFLHQ